VVRATYFEPIEEDDLPRRAEVLRRIREKEAEQSQDHIAPLPPGDFIIYADPP
jgi:hypothetical protein